MKTKQILFRFLVFLLPLGYSIYAGQYLLSYVSNSEGLLTIVIGYDNVFDSRVINKKLVSGVILKSQVEAKVNNLGGVGVRFYNFDKINDDVIIFRIKEKGNDEWYYRNEYKVDQFQPDQIFTFGFPILENSDGKIYEFEIESVNGSSQNAVGISRYVPRVTTKYKLARDQVFGSLELFVFFIWFKLLNLLVSSEFLLRTMTWLMPFLLYWIGLLFFVKKYKGFDIYVDKFIDILKIKKWFWFVPLLLMCVEIFVIKVSNDLLLLMLLFYGVVSIRVSDIRALHVLCLCILLFLLYPIFFMIGLIEISEKIAIWGYLLIFVGILYVIINGVVKNGDKL